MHSNTHEQHLLLTQLMRRSQHGKKRQQIHLRDSWWVAPWDTAKTGKLCWIYSANSEPLRHICNSTFKGVLCHFTHLCDSSFKFFEKHANTLVLVMQCMPRNNNLCGVLQSHHHNLKFTSSKSQGKKSHSMSRRLPIQVPAEL